VSRFATLLNGGSFFEAPRRRNDRWWVSDFYRQRVLAVDPDAARREVMRVEGQPSGLGWLPDGSLLVVSMHDRRVLRRSPDGQASEHADLAELCGGSLNDMVVDRHGRAYVGELGFDTAARADPKTAVLVRVDPSGATTVAAEDMYFPQRVGDHPRRGDPDRGGDDGGALHRLSPSAVTARFATAGCGRSSAVRRT